MSESKTKVFTITMSRQEAAFRAAAAKTTEGVTFQVLDPNTTNEVHVRPYIEMVLQENPKLVIGRTTSNSSEALKKYNEALVN